MRTVYIRGQVPGILKDIPAQELPAIGEQVQIIIAKNNHFVGNGRVLRIDECAGTYDVDTNHMRLKMVAE